MVDRHKYIYAHNQDLETIGMFLHACSCFVFKLNELQIKCQSIECLFLPDDKILAWSKLKACPDDNPNLVKMGQFFFDKIENIVRKGKMLVTNIFSPFFSQCLLNGFFRRGVKSRH